MDVRQQDPVRHGPAVAAVLLVCASLLSACSPGGEPDPALSMSAAEREAYDHATAAVVAYRQVVADLYTGERSSLSDLAAVAVDPEQGVAARNISQARAFGYRSEPVGADVTLVSAEPSSVELGADPATVVLMACIDATGLTAISPNGIRVSGRRERLEYRVVHQDSLPGSGWIVSTVVIDGTPQDREC